MNKRKQPLTHHTPSKNEGVRMFCDLKSLITIYIYIYHTHIHHIHQKRKTRVKPICQINLFFYGFPIFCFWNLFFGVCGVRCEKWF